MSISSIGMEPIAIHGLAVIYQAGDSSCIGHRDLALIYVVKEIAICDAIDVNRVLISIS